ncbi:hypothetical protein TNCV_5087181 [Trichonephila clavipes]|nr:hypothetical protein TNCV_5087181 [Trichonephila clavipes]
MVGNVFVQRWRCQEEHWKKQTYVTSVLHRPQRSMEQFYKHLGGRYAPDLCIGRRKSTISRKIETRKIPTERCARPAGCLLICIKISDDTH